MSAKDHKNPPQISNLQQGKKQLTKMRAIGTPNLRVFRPEGISYPK